MKKIALFVGGVVLIVGLMYWGKLTFRAPRTVTVTGTAQQQKTNEMASFTAGVNAVNDSKEKAVEEVNQKSQALIESVKTFGIPSSDIKTQNMNIYQSQESYYEDGRQKQRLGQWNVGNSIEITLREIVRVQELSDLLSQSGANNVYGPNFALDTSTSADNVLFVEAMNNAREKATSMAQSGKATLGKVIAIQEGSVMPIVQPFYAAKGEMGGGGGAPVEVGSTTVSKSLTVTFELR